MPRNRPLLAVALSLSLGAAALRAQTVPNLPIGISIATENAHAVTGVRIRALPDGTVWFLVPSNDRIVQLQLQGNTIKTFKQWQIRADADIGANPADFQLEGDCSAQPDPNSPCVVWFICNGESLIDPGQSIFARLDTSTNVLREWILPGSKPAGFWRAPLKVPSATCPAPCYGEVWIPQTDGRLQSVDLNIPPPPPPPSVPCDNKGLCTGGPVTDYKSRSDDGTIFTFAYSDVVYGPDNMLWMTDFGNNRIVRYEPRPAPIAPTDEPRAPTETSWTFFDPNVARLNPSQIRFDENGKLWISQLSGSRIDLFDPVPLPPQVPPPVPPPAPGESMNILTSFTGFTTPIHFDIFQGRIYVAEETGSNGVVAVLDPNLISGAGAAITGQSVPVHNTPNPKPAFIRSSCPKQTTLCDFTITPTTFAATSAGFTTSDLTVTDGGNGIVFTSFNSNNAYGITIADGYVWTGSDGKIVRLLLQNLGEDDDLAVPIVFERAAVTGVSPAPPFDRVDVTLANQGDSTILGNLVFMYSPAASAAIVGFTINPRSTAVLEDVFHGVPNATAGISGPVRVQVVSGTAADLSASARSVRVRDDGANFGFALPALNTMNGGLGLGEEATLFAATRDAETATLGLYTSSAGAGAQPGQLALVAADGTVRATLSYNLANNTLEEFTPPASAFGLPAQAGDAVRISAGEGKLRAFVRLVDSGSGDTAMSEPVKASGDAVLPFVATGLGEDGTGPVSDLYLSNPDPANPAHVTVTFLANSPPEGTIARRRRPGDIGRAQAAVVLPPGSSTVLRDVLSSLLGRPSGSGSLVITSDIPVASAVRLALRKSEGDYATVVGAYDGSQSVPAGGSAFASGLQEIPSVRSTDLVLFNRAAATTVTVVGFDGNGSEISRLTINLGAGQSRRLAAVLHQLALDGPGEIDNARVRVDALAGSQVYAAFAQTDAVSGDVEWTRPQ
jgi:hypothetical protein